MLPAVQIIVYNTIFTDNTFSFSSGEEAMEKTAICKFIVNLSFNFLIQKWRSGIEVLGLSIQSRKIEKKILPSMV